MCTLCGSPHVSEPPGFCLRCTIEIRREFYEGLDRLYEYLAAWAAFEEWDAARQLSGYDLVATDGD
ncbi:MAG TPA: hypothetical protein VGJ49_03355 [Gaiellaceae bacterium]|jgi:hypothetical protein